MDFDQEMISPQSMRREKEKARRLRNSAWWMKKTREGICHYCNRRVGKGSLTMDHIVPLSRGGKSKKGNLVPACKDCNNRKKYLLPIEWEEYLNALAGRSSSL
jgi:5-methylcytosine-specific restriction protein A